MTMGLLVSILVAEISVAVCSVGVWIYYRSRQLDKWVRGQDMHYSDTHRQDFDENWAAFTMGYLLGIVMIGCGLLGLFITLLGPLMILLGLI